MAETHAIPLDLDALDSAALKALIRSQQQLLLSSRNEIENLNLLIAKLRRMQFGTRSEKLDRHIEQLELRLEDLESSELQAEEIVPDPSVPGGTSFTAPLAALSTHKFSPDRMRPAGLGNIERVIWPTFVGVGDPASVASTTPS